MDIIISAAMCGILAAESIIMLNFPCVIEISSNTELNEAAKIAKNTYRKGLILWLLQFIIWVGFVIGFLISHSLILALPIIVFILGIMLSGFYIILNKHRYKNMINRINDNS